MIDPKKIEQFARLFQRSLPKSIRDLGSDMEKAIHQILQNQFSRMDLVSREEFDVQTQVLLRTREKLNQLEYRINALESMLKENAFVNKTVSENDTLAMIREESSIVEIVDDKTKVLSFNKRLTTNSTIEENN